MENNSNYYFTDKQEQQIADRWNESYVKRILLVLKIFSKKWQLSNIQLFPCFSQNCVFTCYSDLYGDAVIKIGYHSLANEYNCLREFAGRNICEVFDADLSYNVILEQRVTPGNSLLDEKNQDNRIEVFASIFESLHIVPRNDNLYLTMQAVVNKKIRYIQTRKEYKRFSGVIDQAKAIFESITLKYNDKKLLHGDLHQNNILLSQNGKYIAIDADGYIGDPVFDTSRFIMLEFGDDLTGEKEESIIKLIEKLGKRLDIPSVILIQCLFLDNVLWLCSDLERGESLEESQFIIDNIFAAERLMNR